MRFTHDAAVPRLHARHVLQAAAERAGPLPADHREPHQRQGRHHRRHLSTRARHPFDADRIASGCRSDRERSPDGIEPNLEVGAGKYFAVDLAVGTSLFFFIVWLRLRWFWEIVAAAFGTAVAAFAVAWMLFNYGGYFLGVFASLAGVVLGVVVDLSWKPTWIRFKAWLSEFGTKWREMRAAKKQDLQTEEEGS